MDLATIIGLFSAFALVIWGILLGGPLSLFWDLPSAFIVMGGTLGATLIHYPLKDVFGMILVLKNVFFHRISSPNETIKVLVDLSRTTRKSGILSLEPFTRNLDDAFFSQGVRMIVDGAEVDSIKSVLEREMDYTSARHRLGAEIFTTMGAYAPALGMIGTLIGLIQMLQELEDPSKIGPGMAVALITTFYGAMLAYLFFLPIAGKLKTRSKQEMLVKALMMEGVVSVASGENPRVMEEKLKVFLSPKQRGK